MQSVELDKIWKYSGKLGRFAQKLFYFRLLGTQETLLGQEIYQNN